MKKLISIFAVLMISFGMIFNLASCGKNNDSGNHSGETGGGVVTSQQILKFAFDDFDEKSKAGQQNNYTFASKTGETYNYKQYDENVYLGMNILNEVSKISGLVDNIWQTSQETTLESGKANKVYALKLSSSTEGDVVTIDLVVKFAISGYDVAVNQKTYNLYDFDVVYNKQTQNVTIDAVYEKSRDVENLEYGNYSKADCFKFNYENGVVTTICFERNIDIEDLTDKTLINANSITGYNFFKFNLMNNSVATELDGFNQEPVFQNSIISSVQEVLICLKTTNTTFDNIQATGIQVHESLFKATNAENISNLTN